MAGCGSKASRQLCRYLFGARTEGLVSRGFSSHTNTRQPSVVDQE